MNGTNLRRAAAVFVLAGAAILLLVGGAGRAVAQSKVPDGGPLAKLPVAKDLDARLAQWKPLKEPFEMAGLNAHEIQMVSKLVEAANYLEQVYWRESDPEAL